MMFRPLALRVPFGDGESLTSFCSRLAFRNGCDSAREFCRDMGLVFQDVIEAKDGTLSVLANLGGVDVGLVGRSAIRKIGRADYELNDHPLPPPILRRGRLRICPSCLAEDLVRWPDLEATAPFERTEWNLSSLRTCQRHDIVLAELSRMRPKAADHDFCGSISPLISQLDELVMTASRRKPSDFEIYLRRRLIRVPDPAGNWLDRLPVYAAAKTCEVLGAVEIYGPKVTITGLNDVEMWEAAQAGYEIVVTGSDGIRQLLGRLTDRYWSHAHASGHRSLFGKLYTWLNDATEDPAYDPVREILRNHILESIPMGPEDEIFGAPVGRRRLWSVHAAVKATGTHRQRLRRLLGAGGVIDAADEVSDDRVVFSADESTDRYLQQIADSMELKEVGKYISASRAQLKLLFEKGFIKPFAGGNGDAQLDYAFAKQDLDQFLTRLLDRAGDLQDPRLVDIPAAAKKARCFSMDVVTLLLEGKLSRVGRKTDAEGYAAVLVDPEEIHALLFEEKHDGLSIREVAKTARWADAVVRALLDHGHLPARVIRNPITRMPQRVVASEDLEIFRDRYISLHQLARERKQHSTAVRLELEERGIRPAFSPDHVPSRFYARSDLESS